MLKKLKSALKSAPKSQLLQLALKSLFLAAILVLAGFYQSYLAAVLFVFAAVYLYLRPFFHTTQFWVSFLLLTIFSLWLLMSDSVGINNAIWLITVAIFLGILWFWLLGSKNFIFIHRQTIYHLLNNVLFLCLFFVFFGFNAARFSLWQYLTLFAAFFLLFREFLRFEAIFANNPGASLKSPVLIQKTGLNSAFLAFLTIQIIWLAAVLPLGFLNASAFVFLTMLVLKNSIIHHFNGTLSRQLVLRNITLFLVFSLIITFASQVAL